MEGLAWLLLKMASLLALTGGAFFSLGWWLRGKQTAPSQDDSAVREIEQWKSAARSAEAARDATREQFADAEARIESAEREIARLRLVEQAAAAAPSAPPEPPAPPDLVLAVPGEEAAKPKPKAKPRAKKKPKA